MRLDVGLGHLRSRRLGLWLWGRVGWLRLLHV